LTYFTLVTGEVTWVMATKPISKKDLDIFGDKLKRTVERVVDQKVVLEVGKAKEEILDEQRKFLKQTGITTLRFTNEG